jgi:hypothetical protein
MSLTQLIQMRYRIRNLQARVRYRDRERKKIELQARLEGLDLDESYCVTPERQWDAMARYRWKRLMNTASAFVLERDLHTTQNAYHLERLALKNKSTKTA